MFHCTTPSATESIPWDVICKGADSIPGLGGRDRSSPCPSSEHPTLRAGHPEIPLLGRGVAPATMVSAEYTGSERGEDKPSCNGEQGGMRMRSSGRGSPLSIPPHVLSLSLPPSPPLDQRYQRARDVGRTWEGGICKFLETEDSLFTLQQVG